MSESVIGEVATREVFWGVPGWAEVLWYVLATLSVVVFAYGCWRPIAKYRQGPRGTLPPRRELPARVRRAARTVLAQANVARRSPVTGWAHRGIFYGFVVLFIGTVVLAINTDVTERFFGWRFFEGDFYLGYSLVLDVFGIFLLVGVLVMMLRRSLVKPDRLDYRRPDRPDPVAAEERRKYVIGDWVFVGTLLYLVLGGYVLEGLRMAMDGGVWGPYSPIGWLCGQGIDALGFSEGTLGVFRRVVWWTHGLVAIAFVASIPFTKAAHMLVDFASLVLRDPLAGKRLAPVPASAPAVGYGTLADFSIPHLVQIDACTKCGKCHEACPANATGLPLSPRDVILQLHEESKASVTGGGLFSLLEGGSLDVGVIGAAKVREDTLWSCMQCNACVEICPVGIEQAPIINQMRRRLVDEGRMGDDVQETLQTIHRSGNSFGENRRKRARWTRELDFEIKDARKEPVDLLWFVGDFASFDPRSQEVTRAIARILHAAGVDFGILYDGERNSGNDVRRIGEEGLFEELAEANMATLAGCEFQRIVTSDPHSLNTLANEYGDLGGEYEVAHHTTVLLELAESGRLDLAPLGYRVTYHDPCYLGRHNGGYDAPRALLGRLGCELLEMPRNRDNSFCCGAGGGRIWMTEPAGRERPSENRIREAVGLDDEVEIFVVSCPKDVTMYEDAIKTSGNEERLRLRELTELIEESMLAGADPSGGGIATVTPSRGS